MIVKKYVNNFLMNLNLSDGGISSILYQVGERERAFMSLLDRTVEEGMVCLDLGANIGYTTLHMLKNVGDSGFVYAIEPGPNNLELLKMNIQDNKYEDSCEITQCAISSEDSKIDFWLSEKPNLNSVEKIESSTKKIQVDGYKLGTFLKERKFPNFIKMDVEGHEVKIFEGALEYFRKNKGHTNLFVEVHPSCYNKENDFASILNEYFKIGFKSKYIVATPIPQPELFKQNGYTPKERVQTDGFYRGIYDDVSNEHLVEFACKEHQEGTSKKVVRSFMITRDK